MKISRKLTLTYLSVSLVALIAVSVFTYHSTHKALSNEVFFHIEHVAGTKLAKLEHAVDDYLERLAMVTSRTQLRLSLASYNGSSGVELQEKLNRILTDSANSVGEFKELHVLSLYGEVIASTNPSIIGNEYRDNELFVRGQKTHSADTFYLDSEGRLGLRLAGPIRLDNSPIGALVVESNATNIIEVVDNYHGLGKTGETLLVRQLDSGDAQFIAPTRFDTTAALSRTVSKNDTSSPVMQSLSGVESLFTDAFDYLGNSVIAATRYSERTGWGVVVQQHRAEVFAPINRLRYSLITIVVLVALVIAGLAVIVARSFTRPIAELTEAAKKISGGDLSHRADLKQSDEVGILANAFNRMTEYLVQHISERKAAEDKFYSLLRSTPDATVIADNQGKIVLSNIQAEKLFGYTAEELKGKAVESLMPERYRSNHGKLRKGFQSEPRFRPMASDMDLYALRKDGSEFPIEVSLSPIITEGGTLIASAIRDVSERKKTEALLVHQANFDSLTNLPNRALAFDRLSQALVRAKRTHNHVALMFIDLDRFKDVNDTLGHAVGDKLLVEIAKRLQFCVRGDDTVARLGGDEFLIILSDLNKVVDVELVVDKVLTAIRAPCLLDQRELFVTASIGITSYPDDSDSADVLLRNADVAMYQAKNAGRNTSRFFTHEINAQLDRRLELESLLRYAIDNDELSLYYQPQVCINSFNVVGAEALLRWNSPKLGMIAPTEFIPIAEDSGLILSIGEWVLMTACRDAKAWSNQVGTPLRVAVNISPQQFKGDALVDTVAKALEESDLSPELLELEITENLLLEEASETSACIDALKKLGVRLSLDDFGTGYSSLSYLKRFPFDVLKIDQSFVADIPNNIENGSLCKAIMAMADSLNLTIVAEGVEVIEQLEFLRKHGANIIQGYYFSKPVTVNEFEGFIGAENNLRDKIATWS